MDIRRHLAALSLCLPLLLAACGSEVKQDALPSGSAVLALGDSLTEGVGVKREEAWPALLAEQTGWAVVNGGVSGNTSSDALQRLPALLDEHKPVLVLVMLGGNDMLRKIQQQQTVDNLAKIIVLCRASGAQPVLLGTPQPSLAGAVFQSLSAPDFYRELAEAQQVTLIEDAMAEVLSDPRLKADQLHPNAAGHVLFTEKLLEELKRYGLVR
jgi:lysophospholipase L1-like esterase